MTKVVAFPENKHGSAFKRLFNNTILHFKITGYYVGDDFSGNKRGRFRLHLHKVYCILITLCLSVYTCLLLSKLIELQPLSSSWMKTFGFCTCFFASSLNLILSSFKLRRSRLQNWLTLLSRYNALYKLNAKTDNLKKIQIISTGLGLLACIGFNALLMSNPQIGKSVMIEATPIWLNHILQFVAWLPGFLTAVFFMNLIMLGSICICYEFESISEKMKELSCFLDDTQQHADDKDKPDTRVNDVTDDTKIGDLYKQHHHLCVLLSEFNGCINHFLLVTFFLILPLACVMFYFMLTRVESDEDLMVACGFMTFVFIYPIILCWVGSKVNLKAHEPLQYLWKIPPSALSEKAARELLMFTTKLTGPPIGYSVYELFTITLPASLTIAGTLLTYFVVVVQFKPSDRELCGPSLSQEVISNVTSLLQNLYNKTSLFG